MFRFHSKKRTKAKHDLPKGKHDYGRYSTKTGGNGPDQKNHIDKRMIFPSILCCHRGDRHPAQGESCPRRQDSRHDNFNDIPGKRIGTASATSGWDRRTSNRENSVEQRAKLTEGIDNIFWEQNKHQDPKSHRFLAQCDFIYDALILTANSRDQIRRRLVVDFETDVNVMAHDVQQALSARMDPYSGPAIKLPGQVNVQPIGSVVARWKMTRGNKLYQTTFLVIENSRSDLLLGRTSVKEHCLFRVDPEIASRLNASYDLNP